MGRKVFLSFLGLNKYELTHYYFDNNKEEKYYTPFTQEAILRHLTIVNNVDVHPIVFITKEAKKNWIPNENNDGLKNSLMRVNSNFKDCDVEITSGKSELEIWNIFLSIFDQLREDDNIYIDITHGFRSSPMLAMVLLNYAKFLKNIKVAGIYYGAFETKEIHEGFSWSPIWDLTPFNLIQDWTNAANQFLKTGNGLMLSELIDDDHLKSLKDAIAKFSKEILVNRGPSIYSGETQVEIKTQLENLNFNHRDPLNLILEKVKGHFSFYKFDSIKNGLNAVKWCMDNGLIQQGTTLLEEFTTSYILIKINEVKFLQDKNVRGIVSSALSVSKDNYIPKKNLFENKHISLNQSIKIEEDIVSKVYALENYKKISLIVNRLKKSIRDDINHAGFRENPRTYDEFKNSLTKRYNELLKVIQ